MTGLDWIINTPSSVHRFCLCWTISVCTTLYISSATGFPRPVLPVFGRRLEMEETATGKALQSTLPGVRAGKDAWSGPNLVGGGGVQVGNERGD